ncbi:hypothetical protein [Acholeplasma equifetale]|uniref:hypothetical protein n=1 Tax=Acholeplasma equifetale TaxID=264634 RepID=UPI000ABCD7DE|nr:hypothetical protein [Acholeplasma equifetale]
MFARLIFYGTVLLNRTEQEVWFMPIGHLLDQWEIYKQFNGIAKPKQTRTIDDVIPFGI